MGPVRTTYPVKIAASKGSTQAGYTQERLAKGKETKESAPKDNKEKQQSIRGRKEKFRKHLGKEKSTRKKPNKGRKDRKETRQEERTGAKHGTQRRSSNKAKQRAMGKKSKANEHASGSEKRQDD